MTERESIPQSDFMIEKMKERPINRRKLIRRTVITAAMAVIFGLIACVTFLLLEPVISNWLYPPEEPAQVAFPEDLNEMAPEDMLSENLSFSNNLHQTSQMITNKEDYSNIYAVMAEYVDELNHSMVTVTGVRSNIDWFSDVEESKYQSSGVIIANNGQELLVLVDYTPLRKAESMTMTFSYLSSNVNEQPKYQIPITLKEQDNSTNLAILSANLEDIPAKLLEKGGITIAGLGSSNITKMTGVPVVALGSPMGISGSVGYGMITSVVAQHNQADSNYKLLQTDIYGSQKAEGVLFNLEGKVIGVITNQNTGTDMKNMVSAYGISELKKRIEKMSNGKKVPYAGISAVDVTEDVYNEQGVPQGAFIKKVEMNSPAMLAGIKKGDVLTAFDDKDIYSYNDYITALMQKEPGQTVKLTVMRSSQGAYKEMKISIVLDVQ